MSETETIQQLVLASLRQPTMFDAPEGRTFVALPNADGGYELEQITSANKADVLMPKQVTQAVKIQTVGSLITYVDRFKNADSALFADINANRVVAIVDYHQQPEANTGTVPCSVCRSRRSGRFGPAWTAS